MYLSLEDEEFIKKLIIKIANMENKKSDIRAKRAFCDELLKRGYDSADIVSASCRYKSDKGWPSMVL